MTLRTIKNKIKDIYGDHSASWFDNSYIVDWQVSEGYFLKIMHLMKFWQDCRVRIIHSRSIHSGSSDLWEGLFLQWPTYSASAHFRTVVSLLTFVNFITYTNPVIRISSYTNNLIAGAVPVILVIVIGGYRNSLHEIHHGLLAAISGRFVVHTTTCWVYRANHL